MALPVEDDPAGFRKLLKVLICLPYVALCLLYLYIELYYGLLIFLEAFLILLLSGFYLSLSRPDLAFRIRDGGIHHFHLSSECIIYEFLLLKL